MTTPRLRLAYLISQYPAVNHTYLLREVRELRRNGLEVEVVSILGPDRSPEALDPVESAEWESTYYVACAGPARWLADHIAAFWRQPLRYLAAIAYAVRLGGANLRETARWLYWFGQAVIVGRRVASRGFTHVHCHYASSVALMASRIFSFSVSNTFHGPAEFEDPSGFRLREKIESSRFVVAISEFAKDQLTRYSPCSEWPKLTVCRLGVETARYAAPPAEREGGSFTVLTVGRLSPEKGISLLIGALRDLIDSGRDIRARIVGDGPLRAVLADQLGRDDRGGRIRLEGALNHDAVIPLYSSSHAFVLPSLAEGLPVVLMEAMAAGLPCVATRITGIPELIEDGADGLLVPAGDAAALVHAVARLMDDEELRQRLSKAARRKVTEFYEAEINGRALAEIFRLRLTGTRCG